jgi:hypothetical protein
MVLIRPNGRVAYVSCSDSHQIAAIQINDWSVKLVEAGRGQMAWLGLSDFQLGAMLPRLGGTTCARAAPAKNTRNAAAGRL